jgi:hypothetical protein
LIGQIQHKELVTAYLEDPTIMSEIMDNSWVEAAQDSDDTGGVSLMMDDVPDTETQSLIPQSVDTRGDAPAEQEMWPSLADASTIPKDKKSQKSGGYLPDFMSALKIQEEEIPRETLNVLEHQFWNPMSDKYSPEYFHHPIEDHYTCPFPLCRFRFPIAEDITTHIKNAHSGVKCECPCCYKRYDKVWKVLNHLELGTDRCKVKHVDDYFQYVDKFSGGLVTAKYEYRTDCSRPLKYIKYTVDEQVSLKLYNPKKTATVGRHHEQ